MESTIVDIRKSLWIFAFKAPFYFLSAKLAMDAIMTITEALFTFLFGVALPSWDVYSDLIFSFTLIIPRCYNYEDFNSTEYRHIKTLIEENPYDEIICTTGGGTFKGHPKFGIIMLVPVFLAMCFILPHWWKNEQDTSLFNQIITFILVLFQFYPQWRMFQVLYLGLWMKDIKWKEEKENLQRNLGSLEPFLESIPQVLILLCLCGQEPKLISGQEHFDDRIFNTFFFATLSTSVISAAKGIASFLLEGPCRLLSKKGLSGGMGTMGFFFLCLNITTTLLGKGFLLGATYGSYLYGTAESIYSHSNETIVLYWACFNLLPQLILAFVALTLPIGIKKALKIIFMFPPIILTPMFCIWTMNSLTSKQAFACGTFDYKSQKIGISYWLTWINFILTFVSGLAYQIFTDYFKKIFFEPYLLVFYPCLLITLITLILLQYLDKCFGCCCPCCITYCYPVTEFTYLDVYNLDALITEEDIEMDIIENEM